MHSDLCALRPSLPSSHSRSTIAIQTLSTLHQHQMTTTEESPKAASSILELEETVARLSAHKGVSAVLILHGTDIISMTNDALLPKATLLLKITTAATTLVEDDGDTGSGDLQFIRINSQQKEILIAPFNEYTMVVWHNPHMSGM